MSHRYAVLWESTPERRACPVGLVVEQEDHVLVEARDDLALPRRYDAPFVVSGPDLQLVQYTTKHRQYFDQVLLDLSRSFTIGQEGSVGQATEGVILRLLSELVFRPMRREHVVDYYETARTFPTVKAYQHKHWGPSSGPTASPTGGEPPVRVGAGRDSVAA